MSKLRLTFRTWHHCQKCGKPMPKKRLANHIRKHHPNDYPAAPWDAHLDNIR